MTVPTRLEALSGYLDEHLATEAGAIDALEKLVEGRSADIVTFVIGLILEDERRHHQLFTMIHNSLESTIQWRDIEPRVPTDLPARAEAASLLTATEKLLEIESADVDELAELRRQWEHDGGEHELWAVLVEIAELDTRKHIRLLRHVEDELRRLTR